MKITISDVDGDTTLRTVRLGDWTFRQARKVEELVGLMPEDVLPRIARNINDYQAVAAFAIVAFMLAGRDPAEVMQMGIDSLSLDYSDVDQEATDDDRPPAEGGEAALTADGTSSPAS